MLATTANAEPAKPRVDWERGLVVATGTGVADRHAPSPEIARGTARRGAEEAARKQLADTVATLPLAAGGHVSDKLADAAIKARVDAAVAHAITITADPETDGAWTIALAVPIEAVREAIAGPRAIVSGKGGDHVAAAIVVDGATVTPAVGWTIHGVAAPTLFVKSVPAWAKDAPHVKARGAANGAIDADATADNVATVFVILTP